MSEEDFDKKLMYLEGRIIDAILGNLNQIYMTIDGLKSDLKAERADLKDKLVKTEARLEIYETIFEKLNLNINLNSAEKEEE